MYHVLNCPKITEQLELLGISISFKPKFPWPPTQAFLGELVFHPSRYPKNAWVGG